MANSKFSAGTTMAPTTHKTIRRPKNILFFSTYFYLINILAILVASIVVSGPDGDGGLVVVVRQCEFETNVNKLHANRGIGKRKNSICLRIENRMHSHSLTPLLAHSPSSFLFLTLSLSLPPPLSLALSLSPPLSLTHSLSLSFFCFAFFIFNVSLFPLCTKVEAQCGSGKRAFPLHRQINACGEPNRDAENIRKTRISITESDFCFVLFILCGISFIGLRFCCRRNHYSLQMCTLYTITSSYVRGSRQRMVDCYAIENAFGLLFGFSCCFSFWLICLDSRIDFESNIYLRCRYELALSGCWYLERLRMAGKCGIE